MGRAKAEGESGTRRIGLIAGDGGLPLAVARAIAKGGDRVCAVGFEGLTEPSLAAEVESLAWREWGQVESVIRHLRDCGVREAVMVGKVSKTHLYGQGERLELDPLARELLAGAPNRSDDVILNLVAGALEASGVRLLPQAGVVPEWVVEEGLLAAIAPTDEQCRDIAFGWPIARALGGVDVGQTVVVERGAVLAVEAIEGTDEAIRRGGRLGSGNACVVKLAKPDQDPRFDVPVIGVGTLDAMRESGVRVLACEAGATLAVEPERLEEIANREKLVVVGVAPSGPQPAPSAPRPSR